MRSAAILYKDQEAGLLTELEDGTFSFRYHDDWLLANRPAISLTLPTSQQEYFSRYLFPFFFHMLPEGSNKAVVCGAQKIDSDDYFGLLLSVAGYDTIGAVRVLAIVEES